MPEINTALVAGWGDRIYQFALYHVCLPAASDVEVHVTYLI